MKPTIYRITHLWPNKQPGQGLTAQIEEDQAERWTIYTTDEGERSWIGPGVDGARRVVPADSSTVQIKPETDELNALPSRFVSLQDYEALEREARS